MAHDAFAERRLMLAVLEDALRTLVLAKRAAIPKKRLSCDLAWVRSTSHAEPFAFENICDVLGLDAGYMRDRLFAGTFVPPRPDRRGRGPRTSILRSTGGGSRPCSASF